MGLALVGALHYASWFWGAIGDKFWTFAAEGLGNVTVPADRLMGGEDFRQFLGGDVLPFRSTEVGAEERRSMIDVMERGDGLVTKYTALPFIPL